MENVFQNRHQHYKSYLGNSKFYFLKLSIRRIWCDIILLIDLQDSILLNNCFAYFWKENVSMGDVILIDVVGNKWQISPFGIVLQTIFLDGVVLKHFPDEGSFVRVLHACNTQIARTTGEFGLRE